MSIYLAVYRSANPTIFRSIHLLIYQSGNHSPHSPLSSPSPRRPPPSIDSAKRESERRRKAFRAGCCAARPPEDAREICIFSLPFLFDFFSAPFISHFIVDFLVFFFCILMTIISIFFPRYFLPSVPFPSITCSVFSSTSIFSHLSYPLILLHYLKLTRRLHKSADLSIKQINKGNDPATITRAKTISKCAIGNITHH